ncbi:MAG: hypothetical protein ABSD48_06935 [Armatimonadota bacterium]|jgi:hypothetical protein
MGRRDRRGPGIPRLAPVPLPLRHTAEFLGERLACAERRLKAAHIRKPYSLAARLHILWCIERFGIPRRQIPMCSGVARATVWRWLHRTQDGLGMCGRKCQASVAKTSEALESLVGQGPSDSCRLPAHRLSPFAQGPLPSPA